MTTTTPILLTASSSHNNNSSNNSSSSSSSSNCQLVQQSCSVSTVVVVGRSSSLCKHRLGHFLSAIIYPFSANTPLYTPCDSVHHSFYIMSNSLSSLSLVTWCWQWEQLSSVCVCVCVQLSLCMHDCLKMLCEVDVGNHKTSQMMMSGEVLEESGHAAGKVFTKHRPPLNSKANAE